MVGERQERDRVRRNESRGLTRRRGWWYSATVVVMLMTAAMEVVAMEVVVMVVAVVVAVVVAAVVVEIAARYEGEGDARTFDCVLAGVACAHAWMRVVKATVPE